MSSEKKSEANRQNSLKSTGPKTPEGKAKSRQNSLKHGLTGKGTVLPPDEVELFQERLHSWTNEDRPAGEIESYLLSCAVLATVRIDRCAKLDLADVAERREAANHDWEKRHRRRVRTAAKLLEDDPGRAAERLESFAMGCNWLIAEWNELREALGGQSRWTHEHAAQALRLLGLDTWVQDDATAMELRVNFLASQAEIDLDEVDSVCGTSTAHLDPELRLEAIDAVLSDSASARARLEAIVTAEIERLELLRDDLWRNEDGPKLASVIALASFDPSAVGTLRRRYESSSSLDMHRNLNLLARRRLEARQARKRETHAEKVETTPPWWSETQNKASEPPFESSFQDSAEAFESDPPLPDEVPEVPEAPAPNEATEAQANPSSVSTSVNPADVTYAGIVGLPAVAGEPEQGAHKPDQPPSAPSAPACTLEAPSPEPDPPPHTG
jgi:hypothetical protein